MKNTEVIKYKDDPSRYERRGYIQTPCREWRWKTRGKIEGKHSEIQLQMSLTAA